ncbi:papain-like cysteine protease family protein [Streptantibioticus ferralitis]|uniref:Papain-like cysteine protease family protein n=1 Tax=Streptantibioticus ferralitis TaxID=236510 RepID=A0ABT5Z241_9ACTN|nr:papain-like cysteine protease family protein [Streptantibioticus ferralitis]MDF2257891.1 papain-like cysteine protease family protein [Streptantibioticus ferralitis]
MHASRVSVVRRALAAVATAAVAAGLLLSLGGHAQADSLTGTVTGGQGNYRTVNERQAPRLSASIVGRATVGSTVTMTCQVQGDTVENDSRWIWSGPGSFYIADAFIVENTNSLPSCSSQPSGRVALGISMQKQVQDEWCWDASGLTIANYWGYTQYSQNDFCQLAAQNSSLSCNDQPATLDDMANALSNMGFSNSGYDLYRNAYFSEVRNEISGGRPFAVRIGWRSGGGHMNVIYGYDPSSGTIAVGDPWPSTQTYTWWNYNDYVSNSSFQWTHSRIGIYS